MFLADGTGVGKTIQALALIRAFTDEFQTRHGRAPRVPIVAAAEGLTRVLLKGEDISAAIRTEACGAAASRVAAMCSVRDALRERQRALALAPGLVADGRDMGTVVFPDAPLKIYLTASVRARAQRRRAQLLARDESATLARLLEAIKTRDARDRNRQASPLKPAEDALLIDSTGISAQAVFDTVVNEARRRQLAFVAER